MGGALMKTDRGVRSVIGAVFGSIASFCLVAMAIYYKVADVRVNGILHGGPTALAAAMAGLFGGGVVAVVVLVFLLR
jgi:hypothetical protein